MDDNGEIFQYLRASNNATRAPNEAGSFYSVGLESINYNSVHLIFTANLTVHKRVNGVLTQLASVEIGCPSGTELRSIIRGSRLDVWVNGVWYLSVTDTSLPTGQPGVGVRYTTTNAITRVDLGAMETAAPGTTYNSTIVARDYHLNDSTPTTFTVTTPPAGTIDPRRVGVRPLGSYWGAGGEQIDMLSGNLNLSLPLVSAMGRNGSAVNFRLNYNSQLWRKDSAATWKLGRDVGYGYGWRLQAGSNGSGEMTQATFPCGGRLYWDYRDFTYLASTGYTGRYIYNRLLTTTVSGGGQQATLVSNTYDSGGPQDRTGLRNHDTANYGTGFYYRGNLSQRLAGGVTTSFTYDITGMATSASSGGHSISVQPESGANNTVPGVITPNGQANLAQSFDYSSFLGVTQQQAPNGATTSFTFDSSARPTSTTSPRGVVTTYTYNDSVNERWSKATTGARWVKSTKDDLGRTISVSQPNNFGTTSYLYQGNTVTVTDPVLKWKKYTVNALGNLTQVTEQTPSGPNHETYYSYNLRGQLTGVSMPRGSTTQTRTFNYDLATGRLTSAVNPENGTVSYTYNPDGTVATRTQPMGRVEYTYDTYMRVTQIRRYVGDSERTCQQSNFTYDQGAYGWGRLTGVTWGGASCTGGAWSYAYQYDSPGAITQKTQVGGGFTLTAGFTYNNQGQLLSTQYPNGGPLLTYSYDSMSRPISLAKHQEGEGGPWDNTAVQNVVYNAAGQITSMTMGGYTETRSYNALGQMTQQVIPGVLNKTYTFSDTQNDGRITQMTDAISGETVQYQYDSLKRLTLAETSGSQWGQSFSYDGFGNLLGAVRTKGTAPQFSLYPDPATNRLGSGYTFDANGNMTTAPSLTMTYDVENRMVEATHSGNGTMQYVYGPSNERVWVWNSTAQYWPNPPSISFYSVDGTRLGVYTSEGSSYDVYFAGRKIPQGTSTDFTDRLGSTGRHYPYGDRREPPTQDGAMFATYIHSTTTTLDYARNRYYSSSAARFTTVDPFGGSARPGNPQSWNKYSYAGNDPINHNDPSGLDTECITMLDGTLYCGVQVVSSPLPAPMEILAWDQGFWTGFWALWQVWTNTYINEVNARAAPTDTMDAGGSLASKPVVVKNLSKTGNNQTFIENTFRWIAAALADDSDCSAWLQGAQEYISELLGNSMAAHGEFTSTIAAFTGTEGSDVPAGYAAMLVNDTGAFFKQGSTLANGTINGGTDLARVFILLHELAHALEIKDYENDFGDSAAGDRNDAKVRQHCGKTLGRLR